MLVLSLTIHMLALVRSMRLSLSMRTAEVQKDVDTDGYAASSDPIVCDMRKASGRPLKWGADFDKMPIGTIGTGESAFLGRRDEEIHKHFTENPFDAEDEKMLMRLREVCCGGEEVEERFGHAAAEGHWYYSHTLKGFEEEVREALSQGDRVVFRCSVCGTPLFILDPATRPADEFFEESSHHGWPSFRDTDIYIDDATGLPNLDSYDIPSKGPTGKYPEVFRQNAMKVVMSRAAGELSPTINAWKSLNSTAGRLWPNLDFEVHCSHCGAHVGHANPNAPPDSRGNRYCIDAGCIASA